jgi:hypothetical protein
MIYRATPNTVTGYSPYYLLHGREMTPPNRDNLKASVAKEIPEHSRRLDNLRSSLKLAFGKVDKAKKKAHQ